MLELLLLRVLHDRLRLLVLLDGEPLLVPADRLRLLGQRGDHPRERPRLGATAPPAARGTGRSPWTPSSHLRRTANADSGARRRSVPEVPAAGEDHRRAGIPHRGDHLVVALRAARLDDRRHPGVERELRARRRRGRTRRRRARRRRASWPCSRAFSTAIRTASTRLIWPAPMPIVCSSRASTIAFDVTCLTDAPREEQVAPVRLGRARRRRPPSRRGRLDLAVALLDEQPAEHALESRSAAVERAALAVVEDPRRPASGRAPRPRRRRSRARTAPRRTARRAARRARR